MSQLTIELFTRWGIRGRRFYFRIKAGNREIIAQSEGYKRYNDAVHTANLIRSAASGAYLVHISTGGDP